MNINVNIAQLKRQLNIEPNYILDDIILKQCLDVAKLSVQNYLGVNALSGYTGTTTTITGTTGTIITGVTSGYTGTTIITGSTGTTTTAILPISIEQAIIMLAAHWYINRNIVSFAQPWDVPYSFKFLLDYYRNWIVC
jgi:hypothetical protein